MRRGRHYLMDRDVSGPAWAINLYKGQTSQEEDEKLLSLSVPLTQCSIDVDGEPTYSWRSHGPRTR